MKSIQMLYSAVVQGVCEALPVSSTLCLSILSGQSIPLMDLPIAISCIIFFRTHIIQYYPILLISYIPIFIVGTIVSLLKLQLPSCNMIIYLFITLALLVSYYAIPKVQNIISAYDAMLLGSAQVLAIFPGISRLGITMIAGSYINYTILYPFIWLMSVPVFLTKSLLYELCIKKAAIHTVPLLIVGLIFYLMLYIISKIQFTHYIIISVLIRLFIFMIRMF